MYNQKHKPRVYIVTAPDELSGTVFFKVGISVGTHKRMKQIQTSCPLKLKTVSCYNCDSLQIALRLERGLHNILSKYSTVGEWFRLKDNKEVEEANRLITILTETLFETQHIFRYDLQ